MKKFQTVIKNISLSIDPTNNSLGKNKQRENQQTNKQTKKGRIKVFVFSFLVLCFFSSFPFSLFFFVSFLFHLGFDSTRADEKTAHANDSKLVLDSATKNLSIFVNMKYGKPFCFSFYFLGKNKYKRKNKKPKTKTKKNSFLPRRSKDFSFNFLSFLFLEKKQLSSFA